MIQKHQSMKSPAPRERTKLAGLSKLTNKCKVVDIRKHNKGKFERALKDGGRPEAVETELRIARNQIRYTH